MKPSDIVLDAIAEMVATMPSNERLAILHGLESVIFAFSRETGMDEGELRTEIEIRAHLYQVNQRRIRLISQSLSDQSLL